MWFHTILYQFFFPFLFENHLLLLFVGHRWRNLGSWNFSRCFSLLLPNSRCSFHNPHFRGLQLISSCKVSFWHDEAILYVCMCSRFKKIVCVSISIQRVPKGWLLPLPTGFLGRKTIPPIRFVSNIPFFWVLIVSWNPLSRSPSFTKSVHFPWSFSTILSLPQFSSFSFFVRLPPFNIHLFFLLSKPITLTTGQKLAPYLFVRRIMFPHCVTSKFSSTYIPSHPSISLRPPTKNP